MSNATHTPVNQQQTARAEKLLRQLLEHTLRRGFHGSAELLISVQDGTIQHLRMRIDQIDK